MRMHRDASYVIPDEVSADGELLAAARRSWDEAVELGERHGYRNAQATVLAPTGTISFLMDCDTTGVEPDFSLVKFKELVGGGQMTIVNRTVPLALQTLGYSEQQVEQIEAHLAEHGTIVGAPGLNEEHLPVFDVAVGERAISHMGHLKMMGAVQPFISGAISKTVNLPQEATVEDIADAYTQAWRLGIKALAIYRDGSKTAQALRTDAQQERRPAPADVDEIVEEAVDKALAEVGRSASACRASASRSRTSSRSAATRATSPPACTRTARRRDLPHRHRQGGLDAAGHDELVRDGDLDRAAVRRAAGDARAEVQLHALRAGGDHRQPGDPVRQVDARLHHALARLALPRRRRPGGPGHPHAGGAGPQGRPGRRPVGQRLRHGRSERRGREQAGGDAQGLGGTAAAAAAPPTAALTDIPPVVPARLQGLDLGPAVQPVRRHDAAHRLLLHVLELRQQHRLRLTFDSRRGTAPFPARCRLRGVVPRSRPPYTAPAKGSRCCCCTASPVPGSTGARCSESLLLVTK